MNLKPSVIGIMVFAGLTYFWFKALTVIWGAVNGEGTAGIAVVLAFISFYVLGNTPIGKALGT